MEQQKGRLAKFQCLIRDERNYFDEQAEYFIKRNMWVVYVQVIITYVCMIFYQIFNLCTLHAFNYVKESIYTCLIASLTLAFCHFLQKVKNKKIPAYLVPIFYEFITFLPIMFIDVFADSSVVEIYASKMIILAPIIFVLPYEVQFPITTVQSIAYITLASFVKPPKVLRLDIISILVGYIMAIILLYVHLRFQIQYVQERKMKETEIRANRAKTAFLNNMSHDIRTPLNAITGMLHILKENRQNETRFDDCVKKIECSTEHLIALVDDVLDLSKLESDEMVLERVSFDLSSIRNNIDAIYGDLFKKKNITYQVDDKNMNYRRVYGSPLALKRIILNLLSNAYKYTKEGGRVVSIVSEVSYEDNVQIVELRVQDNGIGMSKEFVENQLFQIFSREDDDLASKGINGSGLGMNITKLLVKKMGGTIEVESQQGVGTTFTVKVPFEIDTSCDKTIEEENEEKKEDVTLCGKHFLVAEDNELNREILKYMLEAEGATIDIVENGNQAVELFAKHIPGTYDAILMDVNMPVMNGYEATETIRAMDREDASSIIILAVTANAFAEDVNRSRDAGMNGHITKPIDPQRLKEKLVQF